MANIYLAPNAQDKEENCLAVENFIREVNLLSENPKHAKNVSAGLRVITYTTSSCSFTSLGALGMGTVKCLNAAAGYLKKRAVTGCCSHSPSW